jgi:PAS domain S-box-containing protein
MTSQWQVSRHFDVSAYSMDEPDSRHVAILFENVTERISAARQLREWNETLEARVAAALDERRLFAQIVEGTNAFVQVADTQFRWLAINRAASDEFERIFGVRPTIGASMLDVLADKPEHREAVRAVWSRALAGEEFTEIGEFGDPDLDRRCYEMRYSVLRDSEGRQIGAYQFVYDVTQRVDEQRRLLEAEAALRQSQKMDAMGQLTGGVAHDFNNLLTPIVGSLDMLQRRGVGGDREQKLIANAALAADRARTLVQRLLAFARRQPLQTTAVDIAQLVEEMASLVTSTVGPQIRVVTEIESGLAPALADANQLEMALLNLSVNARDAMPAGGTLTIGAVMRTIGDNPPSPLSPGRYVRLSVSDTGIGMSAETLARAVEPFFSTKGVGRGTGLGLSMVHGLASQLGGGLFIQSEPGMGTQIELWLPAGENPDPAALGQRPAGTALPAGVALLVDDEDLVRASTADMLHELGFGVVEAASAEEALQHLREGVRFDVLVTDHLMTGMSGTELARAITDGPAGHQGAAGVWLCRDRRCRRVDPAFAQTLPQGRTGRRADRSGVRQLNAGVSCPGSCAGAATGWGA